METKDATATFAALTRVLILPMRNGNSEIVANTTDDVSGSYPTYEEWKHRTCTYRITKIHSSYPTYEEWKHLSTSETNLRYCSSYPTYEEWKLH